MTLELAKLLVQEGLIIPSDMDDVLQRQVIFGGSLDTNILELGKLDEWTMTEALSRIHKLPIATKELLATKNPKVANLLPARLAEKYQVLPVAMSGRNIVVLASGRIDPLNEEKLGFILSLKVKTYLVCEARLQQYLQDWLDVYIEPRYKALLARMDPFILRTASAPEQIQEEIQSKPQKQPSVDQDKVKEVLVDVEAAEKAQQLKRKQARTGRIFTDEAIKACFQAKHRDVIVDTILRYARQFLPFVGLFIIDDDHIMGWDAVGSKNASEVIKKIRIPARISTVLSMVVNTRAYYLGPMPKSQPNQALLKSLERPYAPNVLVVPLILKKRLIGLLFGDASKKPIRSNKLGELLLFINVLPQAFEQLLLRKKVEVQSRTIAPQNTKPQPSKSEPQQTRNVFKSWVALQRSNPQPPPTQTETPPKRQPATETTQPTHAPPAETTESSRTEEPADINRDHQPAKDDNDRPSTQPSPASPIDMSPEPAPDPKPIAQPTEPESPPEFKPHMTQPMFERIAKKEEDHSEDITEPEISSLQDPTHEQIASGDNTISHKLARISTIPAIGAEPEIPLPGPIASLKQKPPPEEQTEEEPTHPADIPIHNVLEELQIDQLMSQADNALEERQIDQLVEQLVSDKLDLMRLARKNLLDIGPRALETIMLRFPGKLSFDVRNSNDWTPPIVQHGELIKCLVEIGPEACSFVAQKMEDTDPIIRYYALKILGEITCPAYFDQMSKRLYDPDALIRMAAVDVLLIYRGTPGYRKLVMDLRNKLKNNEPNLQAMAAALLGNLKDTLSLPLLIQLLKSPSNMVTRSAIQSLRYVTKQDFKDNQRKWSKWLKKHKDQQRVQWLIAGLRSKDPDIRCSAAQELHQITDEVFDLYLDVSQRYRRKAARKWETWWRKTGQYQKFEGNQPEIDSHEQATKNSQ